MQNINKSKFDIVRKVIRAEIEGLEALSGQLDPAKIDKAVDLILATSKYLIVVGAGKSGHVGQKLSASFASTGTPSFFLHPAEASHGDLGMIQTGCTLLVISSSGKSKELKDVLQYARKIKVPVIAITQDAKSRLGRAATILLKLPDVGEAGPNGLAPTISTTNTLCLGDALMVAVMTQRGFSDEDFGLRHPGGNLGRKLQTVQDWVDERESVLTTVLRESDMKTVLMAVSEGGAGSTAVIDERGALIGMITDGDLRRAMDTDFFSKSAGDIMSKNPISLSVDMKMGEVVAVLSDKRIGGAYIVQHGIPIGIIDMKTLLSDGYI